MPMPAIQPATPLAAIDAAWTLAALFQDARVGLALHDADLRYVRVNEALAAINGVPVADHLGRHVDEVVPALAGQARAILRQVLDTGRAVRDHEVVGRTPAAPGAERSWRAHWLPVRDAEARVVGVLAMVEETTELRRLVRANDRVSEALARSEAKHAFLLAFGDALRQRTDPDALVAHACALLGERLRADRVGFAELEADGTVLVHPQFARGVARTEGRHRLDDYGAWLLAEMRVGRAVRFDSVSASTRLSAAEKAAHAALGTEALLVVPVSDSQRLAGMFFVNATQPRAWTEDEIDLAEAAAQRAFEALTRARAEAALRDSEQRLRLARDAAGLGIFDFDLGSGERRWDAAIARMWGYPDGTVLTREQVRACVHPDDLPRVDAELAALVARGTDRPHSVEYRIRRHDTGAEAHVVASGLVSFANGVATRVVGAVQDVSALRRAELALREADQRKDEFLAMLAHELRNPLAPIFNSSRLLACERDALSAPARRAIEMIDRQARHMRRLVDDLLDVSRITRGTVELKREPSTLGLLVLTAVDAALPAAQAKRQRLEARLPATPVRLDVDPVRVSQVLENLLGNAIKYTPEGGRIEASLAEDEAGVELRVRDSGIGIPPDKLERVFDLFVQAEPGVGPHQGGLGIGLALVKRLVELHGGTVRAESAGAGRGATLVVRLPAARSTLEAPSR